MKTQQNIQLLDYERGDEVTAAEVNALVLLVTKKLNHLTPANIRTVTTGNFIGKELKNNLALPNYSGIMSGADVFNYINYPITDLNADMERTLSKIMEL